MKELEKYNKLDYIVDKINIFVDKLNKVIKINSD